MGGGYNPVFQELQILALTGRLQDSKALHKAVDDLEKKAKKLQARRKKEFAALEKLFTAIIGVMRTCKLDPKLIADAERLRDKVKGVRRGEVGVNEDGTPKETHSVSQTGFWDLHGHFKELLEIIDDEPGYMTNIAHVTVSALRDHEQMLSVLLTETDWHESQLYTKRTQRYDDHDNLVEIANRVKNEVMSKFGATSDEFKKVQKRRVRKIRRD